MRKSRVSFLSSAELHYEEAERQTEMEMKGPQASSPCPGGLPTAPRVGLLGSALGLGSLSGGSTLQWVLEDA